jgi:hypothetical protein
MFPSSPAAAAKKKEPKKKIPPKKKAGVKKNLYTKGIDLSDKLVLEDVDKLEIFADWEIEEFNVSKLSCPKVIPLAGKFATCPINFTLLVKELITGIISRLCKFGCQPLLTKTI